MKIGYKNASIKTAIHITVFGRFLAAAASHRGGTLIFDQERRILTVYLSFYA